MHLNYLQPRARLPQTAKRDLPGGASTLLTRCQRQIERCDGGIAPLRRMERHPVSSEHGGVSLGLSVSHCGMRIFQNCLRDSSSQNLSAVHGSSSAMLGLAIPAKTDTARRAAVIVFMIISFLRLEPQVWLLSAGLMAQEMMQVRSPRNSLNGLAAPGQGSGEWG